MTLGQSIKRIRKEHDMTQGELAKICGVGICTISAWERGATVPRMGKIEIISEYFGVPKSVLLGEKPKKDKSISRRIPVYGYIPAGIPLEAITAIDDYEDIPEEWEGEYLALRVHGDSMFPRYLDGDIVIIRRQPDCESRQCCAVLIDGEEVTLKQVLKDEQTITLQPINPAYKPHTYPAGEITILGVVVELRRKEL